MNYHPRFAQDRDLRSARSAFIRAKKLSIQYGVRLRKIARHVGDIIRGFEDDLIGQAVMIQVMLQRYADTLTPWAEASADRMIAQAALADKNNWRKVAAEVGRGIAQEIDTAPIQAAMQRLKTEQVQLIRSLPIEAAERIHKLTTEGLAKGMRANELAAEILKTGEVTRSRATLIARTETGRASTALTQARAEHIGSTGYLWRTSRDADVRKSHRAMEGKFVAWDEPPTLDNLKGHAGTIPNCRCYCEVVVPQR